MKDTDALSLTQNTKMSTPVEKKRKTSMVLNSSSRGMSDSVSGVHDVSRRSRHIWSFTGSQTRLSSTSSRGSRSTLYSLDRSANRAPRRVLKNNSNNVSRLSLYHAEPRDMQSNPGRFFLDKIFSSSGSDCLKSTSSSRVHSSSSFMGSSLTVSLLTKSSPTKETEDSVPKLDVPINPPAECEVLVKSDNVKQHVTEEMLDEVVDICLSETDTISLLDIPNTFVSEDADDAEAINSCRGRNIQYAELCKNRIGSDKYVGLSIQTLNGATKEKNIQCDDGIVMVDEGTIATVWDIYDSFCDQNETPKSEVADHLESTVNTSKGQERRGEKSSSSTVSAGCTTSSLLEMEMYGNSLNTEPDPQLIMLSESFQHSLSVMERSIIRNISQPKLAAYKELPILEDPDSTVKPGTEEQSEEGEESSSSPALERLWTFSCELTRKYNVTSMAWNKENPDILAVGYGDCVSSNQEPGLICCWSLKNPMWPECVFHCRSCVTSLDFSAQNPGQLAVGMYDGTVAIYSVQSQNNQACVTNSSEFSQNHLYPVRQVNWAKQEMISGEGRAEVLISVSAYKIAKWFLGSNGLECIDLMMLMKTKKSKVKTKGKKAEEVLSTSSAGLCVDVHPTDSNMYLAGTWGGLIHKCLFCSKNYFLETYQKHFGPVNHIEWSPFLPDFFLSCSSDWTIQLWQQGCFTPVMSFTSTQKAVYAVRWSPNWPTIFAAINGQQVEIWDLKSSIVDPIIVHHAAPGVKLTSLLFARGTDCVMVGDSDGQVTAYQLKNLSVEEGKKGDSLEEITRSVST